MEIDATTPDRSPFHRATALFGSSPRSMSSGWSSNSRSLSVDRAVSRTPSSLVASDPNPPPGEVDMAPPMIAAAAVAAYVSDGLSTAGAISQTPPVPSLPFQPPALIPRSYPTPIASSSLPFFGNYNLSFTTPTAPAAVPPETSHNNLFHPPTAPIPSTEAQRDARETGVSASSSTFLQNSLGQAVHSHQPVGGSGSEHPRHTHSRTPEFPRDDDLSTMGSPAESSHDLPPGPTYIDPPTAPILAQPPPAEFAPRPPPVPASTQPNHQVWFFFLSL
jgi:hypothetical protein